MGSSLSNTSAGRVPVQVNLNIVVLVFWTGVKEQILLYRAALVNTGRAMAVVSSQHSLSRVRVLAQAP